MNDLNIKINGDISEDLLNMKLTDMFCKHVIRRNPDGIQIKAGKLYTEQKEQWLNPLLLFYKNAQNFFIKKTMKKTTISDILNIRGKYKRKETTYYCSKEFLYGKRNSKII